MTEFQVLMKEEMVSPDNLTLPQFILDSTHPRRPLRPSKSPWLIQESTGRQVYYEEVRTETAAAAAGNLPSSPPSVHAAALLYKSPCI
jgi:4-coumarate--CoA ligase